MLAPHPRAKRATAEAARIVAAAAVRAGAPEGIISWLTDPSMADTTALMQSPDVALILATGGPGMVKASYSSGHPALGVGAGNTPAVVDATANVSMAVNYILLSKSFDNGVICASEQAVIVVDEVYDAFCDEMRRRGAYFLSADDVEKTRRVLFRDGRLNAQAVGRSVADLAELFGLDGPVPPGSRVLVARVEEIGDAEPLSREKLSPVLALYR